MSAAVLESSLPDRGEAGAGGGSEMMGGSGVSFVGVFMSRMLSTSCSVSTCRGEGELLPGQGSRGQTARRGQQEA